VRRWWPVFRREFVCSVQAPSLCIFAALFFLLIGVFFHQTLDLFTRASHGDARALAEFGDEPLNITDHVAHGFFGIVFTLLFLAVPFLTMRLVAEERKIGTFELLLSYPLREIDIVVGKFMAAWALVACLLALSLVYPALMWWASAGQLEPLPMVGGYAGLLCISGGFVAIGLLASCLTENQLVAGLLTLGVLLIGILLGNLAPQDSGLAARLIREVDLYEHAQWSLRGVLRFSDVTHFALLTVAALFLAQKVLAFRRLGVMR
jgi:ABC-2 type transport system permease protein